MKIKVPLGISSNAVAAAVDTALILFGHVLLSWVKLLQMPQLRCLLCIMGN
jgi:hypothetical protein